MAGPPDHNRAPKPSERKTRRHINVPIQLVVIPSPGWSWGTETLSLLHTGWLTRTCGATDPTEILPICGHLNPMFLSVFIVLTKQGGAVSRGPNGLRPNPFDMFSVSTKLRA